MPRDINGNYTLPAGNPVTAGTIIESAWANSTMSDIEAALTDSLSRTGSGGMSVPFENADGTMASPGITFANETTSGLYRKTTNSVWMSIGGADIMGWTATSVSIAPGITSPFSLAADEGVADGIATLGSDGKLPNTQVSTANMAGNVKLEYLSTALCALMPCHGAHITISGTPRFISLSGIALNNTDLAANDADYYVFALWSGSAVTLSLVAVSGTTLSVDDYGMTCLSTDENAVLVGMVRKTGGNFVNTQTQRFVRTWFNDPGITFGCKVDSSPVISSAPNVEADSAYRAAALFWANELINGTVQVTAEQAGGLAAVVYCGFGIDGTAQAGSFPLGIQGIYAASSNYTTASASPAGLAMTAGYHYFQVMTGRATNNITLIAGYSGMQMATRRSMISL